MLAYVLYLFVYCFFFFFFNDTATTEIYTLSLHDALPIFTVIVGATNQLFFSATVNCIHYALLTNGNLTPNYYFCMLHIYLIDHEYIYLIDMLTKNYVIYTSRSEEHTSELQSHVRISYAVFCLKKKKKKKK